MHQEVRELETSIEMPEDPLKPDMLLGIVVKYVFTNHIVSFSLKKPLFTSVGPQGGWVRRGYPMHSAKPSPFPRMALVIHFNELITHCNLSFLDYISDPMF